MAKKKKSDEKEQNKIKWDKINLVTVSWRFGVLGFLPFPPHRSVSKRRHVNAWNEVRVRKKSQEKKGRYLLHWARLLRFRWAPTEFYWVLRVFDCMGLPSFARSIRVRGEVYRFPFLGAIRFAVTDKFSDPIRDELSSYRVWYRVFCFFLVCAFQLLLPAMGSSISAVTSMREMKFRLIKTKYGAKKKWDREDEEGGEEEGRGEKNKRKEKEKKKKKKRVASRSIGEVRLFTILGTPFSFWCRLGDKNKAPKFTQFDRLTPTEFLPSSASSRAGILRSTDLFLSPNLVKNYFEPRWLFDRRIWIHYRVIAVSNSALLDSRSIRCCHFNWVLTGF